jgi:hypothetical protein
MQSLAGGVMAVVGGRPAEDVMFRRQGRMTAGRDPR